MEKVKLLKVGILFSALSFAGATLVSESVGQAQDTKPDTRTEAIKKELLANVKAAGADKPVVSRFSFVPRKHFESLKQGYNAQPILTKYRDARDKLEEEDKKVNDAQDAVVIAQRAIFKSSAAEEIEDDLTNLRSYRHENAGDAFRVIYREVDGDTPEGFLDIGESETTAESLATAIMGVVNPQGGTFADFNAKKTTFGTAVKTLRDKSTKLLDALGALHYTENNNLNARRNDFNTALEAYDDDKASYERAYQAVFNIDDGTIDATNSNGITRLVSSLRLADELGAIPEDTFIPNIPAGASVNHFGDLNKAQLVGLLDNQYKHHKYGDLQTAGRTALQVFAAAISGGTTYDPPAPGAAPPSEVFESFENFRDKSDAELAAFFGYSYNDGNNDFTNYATVTEYDVTKSPLYTAAESFLPEEKRTTSAVDLLIAMSTAQIATTLSLDLGDMANDDQSTPYVYDESQFTSYHNKPLSDVLGELELVWRRVFDYKEDTYNGETVTRAMKRNALKHGFVVLQRAGILTASTARAYLNRQLSAQVEGRAPTTDDKKTVLNEQLAEMDRVFQRVVNLIRPFVSLPQIDDGDPIESALNTRSKTMEWLSRALANLRTSRAFVHLGSTVDDYNQFISDNEAPGGTSVDLTGLKTGLRDAATIERFTNLVRRATSMPDDVELHKLVSLASEYEEYIRLLREFKTRYPQANVPTTAQLVATIEEAREASASYGEAEGIKTGADRALSNAKAALESALEDLSGETDLDADEVATEKLIENLEAILELLSKMEGDGPDDGDELDPSFTLEELSGLLTSLNNAKTNEEKAEEAQETVRDEKVEHLSTLGLGENDDDKANKLQKGYDKLLKDLPEEIATVQDRLTEFALLDTLWQHSTMTGTDGFSLEVDTSGSWLTHLLDGAIGDVALTGSYRSGSFHVNLTANYAISYFGYGLENIEWIINDLVVGTLKLGYHNDVGLRSNIYLSGGFNIMSETGKRMYGAGGHLAYTVRFQNFEPTGFTVSLTPSLQIDGALTRETEASSDLGYAKAELGFNVGLHIATDPGKWNLSIAIPIKGSVAGSYELDTQEAGLPPMLGLTTGLDLSATYANLVTVNLGYGFSTNAGINAEKEVSLIYFKHTGRLGLRLDI